MCIEIEESYAKGKANILVVSISNYGIKTHIEQVCCKRQFCMIHNRHQVIYIRFCKHDNELKYLFFSLYILRKDLKFNTLL